MKEQYVGDISDYRKYAILRALSAEGAIRIGVVWMLTPSDGSTDGGKLAYLRNPEKHRCFDPDLFDMLAHAAAKPDRRRLRTIEESGVIPGARYFNDLLSDNAAERSAYMTACLSALADTDLLFFDPDNGLGVPSLRRGWKNSSKFVYLDELRTFYGAGKSLLVYQHFPRIERAAFVTACVERMQSVAPDAEQWAFRTKHVVFLLAVNPAAGGALREAARNAATRWNDGFMTGRLVASPSEAAASVGSPPQDDGSSPLSGEPRPRSEPPPTAGRASRPSSSLIQRLIRRFR